MSSTMKLPTPKQVKKRASDHAIMNFTFMDDAAWLRCKEQAFIDGALWMRRKAMKQIRSK